MQTIAAAIPNISGTFVSGGYDWSDDLITGAFARLNNNGNSLASSTEYKRTVVDFYASRCSNVYKNDCTTVQPPAISLIPQIKY